MRHLTLPAVIALLDSRPGANIVTMRSKSQARLNKKSRVTGEPCPYPDGVTIYSYGRFILGADYASVVETQRQREDVAEAEPFTAQGLWKSKEYPDGAGERIDRYTVRHKGTGRIYFAALPQQEAAEVACGSIVRKLESEWICNRTGNVVDKETLTDYLPPLPKDSGRQGVEVKKHWRTIPVDEVSEIHYGGEVIAIHPLANTAVA